MLVQERAGSLTLISDAIDIYSRDIVDAGRQLQFFILISFLIAFLAVRAITHLIRSGRIRHLHNLNTGGTHIHHMVWGILLLLVTGFVAIGLRPDGGWEILAVLFGIGAALTLDEFALWLNLRDVYWTREGRRSIDAVVVVAVVFGMFLVGLNFWINLVRLVVP
jgi:hypothetical protein